MNFFSTKDHDKLAKSILRHKFPSKYKPNRFFNANFSPYISPFKGAFEKYKPRALFSDFTIFYLYNQWEKKRGSLSYNSIPNLSSNVRRPGLKLSQQNRAKPVTSIERRSVMSRYHGSKCLDDSNREFLQRRRRTAKKQQVQTGKKTTLHVHHAFLYISQPLLHDCDMKLPNFTRPLYRVGEHNTKIFLFFF